MKIRLFLILFIFLVGCATTRVHFRNQKLFSFDNLTLNYALELERKLNSQDISPDYRIGLGKGIYPNEKNYELEISRNFKRIEKPNFSLEVDYHFTKDSTVRIIMYEWNDLKKENGVRFSTDKQRAKRRKVFKSKFDSLTKKLTEEFGNPTFVEIESNKKPLDGNFRDGIKWKNNGMNAYLFAFGNNENSYNQIRLAIYND